MGAGKAISAGLKAAGVSAGEAAGVVLAVVAAAITGWFLGRKIDAFMQSSAEKRAQARADLAVDAVHARLALAQQLGVPVEQLTKEQNKPIQDAYKRALDVFDHPEKYGEATIYAPGREPY